MSDLIGLDKENGRTADADGLSPTAAPVSAVASVPASIPCATALYDEIIDMWLCLARSTRGIVKGSEEWAGEEPKQTLMVMEWAELAEQCYRRAASAIEARRAATPQSGAVHESAVGNAETPNTHPTNPPIEGE